MFDSYLKYSRGEVGLRNISDELYDRQVQFIFSTTLALEHLYQGQKLKFEFQRAMSRLNEMQSDEYQQVKLADAG
ncbi:AFG1/ZapE family ATPase [Thiothrix unzii]|uniref:AFG1/ZapE family ATPase n=1 Tax=Thiothrix unzii TaxID=111769 RepID=UPI001FE54BEE|nr:AFG1/ZapE family ATPase [Thiothrix unzii]